MQSETNLLPGEALRRAMRNWVTGVSIVTSRWSDVVHGMTANSFTSISIDPPLVMVSLNNDTRTHQLVMESGVLGVTVLSEAQQALAERFAGRLGPGEDRMAGLDTFELATGAPLIRGGLAFIDAQVVYRYPTLHSTLFIAEVVAAQSATPEPGEEDPEPLLYHNRAYRRFV